MIYNIPAGQAFAKTLAQNLLQRYEGKQEELSGVRILLPTRRACRVLRDTFLALNNGRPILLPHMTPLGDVEEEDLSLQVFGQGEEYFAVPPAISPLRRQIILARLVTRGGSYGTANIENALKLAKDLGRFLDEVCIAELNFAKLNKIVPDEFSEHWKLTLEFLKIITENWPKILEEQRCVDSAERRNILLRALSQHWQNHPPSGPVIAAGSTGSIPATADLLRVVSRLPQGEVILPGLDTGMEDESWKVLTETHPQFALKMLLDRLEVKREHIKPLVPHAVSSRYLLAREVMRPAETVQRWKDFATGPTLKEALAGLEYYQCQTQQEEAQVITLIMREVLEVSTKTAALITPDRKLARRVSALCARWGISVDDSAGIQLRETNIGKFALLTLKSVAYDPVVLLSLLRSNLCNFAAQSLEIIASMEINVLRQDFPPASYDNLFAALKKDDALFLQDFLDYMAPLKNLLGRNAFGVVLEAHLSVLENLAQAKELWAGEEGEAAARFFNDLHLNASDFPDVSVIEYGRILEELMDNVTIRQTYGTHPRLSILGQLEARLTGVDVVIMGGLNEGVWPQDVGHDPWMSRPMRSAFGLPAAEKSIGLSAHDFVQGFCAPRVVMTRPMRVEGAPKAAARWLQRLETVLKASNMRMQDLSTGYYIFWAREMDTHGVEYAPVLQPSPCPPLGARPDGISITRVEKWLQDPYSIYSHDILRLRKIGPLRENNDLALAGKILHEVMENFTKAYPLELLETAEEDLIHIGRSIFKNRIHDNDRMRFWWPRFLNMVSWIIQQEKAWRQHAKFVEGEVEGNADILIDGIPFNLQGKPDRIDRMAGGYGIIDYKSGSSLKASKLRAGELPQMPLAAMILQRGGFDGKGLRRKPADPLKKQVPAGPVVSMAYWKMTGLRNLGEIEAVQTAVDDVITTVEEGFCNLVRAYREPRSCYISVPDASNAPEYNDYEHLARLKEWAALDDVSEQDIS